MLCAALHASCQCPAQFGGSCAPPLSLALPTHVPQLGGSCIVCFIFEGNPTHASSGIISRDKDVYQSIGVSHHIGLTSMALEGVVCMSMVAAALSYCPFPFYPVPSAGWRVHSPLRSLQRPTSANTSRIVIRDTEGNLSFGMNGCVWFTSEALELPCILIRLLLFWLHSPCLDQSATSWSASCVLLFKCNFLYAVHVTSCLQYNSSVTSCLQYMLLCVCSTINASILVCSTCYFLFAV